jgi:hypothetical protein
MCITSLGTRIKLFETWPLDSFQEILIIGINIFSIYKPKFALFVFFIRHVFCLVNTCRFKFNGRKQITWWENKNLVKAIQNALVQSFELDNLWIQYCFKTWDWMWMKTQGHSWKLGLVYYIPSSNSLLLPICELLSLLQGSNNAITLMSRSSLLCELHCQRF